MSVYEFTDVLVAVDGSEGSRAALDCALSLCVTLGARMTALAVEGKLPAYAASLGEVDEVKREKRMSSSRACSTPPRQPPSSAGVAIRTELIAGHAAEVITHYAAAHGHDLIVVGYRGHFMGDLLLGFTADRVAHHAHCPVMVVR